MSTFWKGKSCLKYKLQAASELLKLAAERYELLRTSDM